MAIGEGTRSERDLSAFPAQGSPAPTRPTGKNWTGSVLNSLSAEWTVLHARHWPGRSYDTIDHIAVGPTGIFVVDSVGWSGEVEVTPDLLRVNGRSRLTAVQTAHDTAREVALLLTPDLRDHVFPVLCFSRDEEISGWVKAVRICSTMTLNQLIETRDSALSTDQVDQISGELEAALPSAHASPSERVRASDASSSLRELPGVEPLTARPIFPWRRTRAGRIAEGGLGLSIVAGLAFIGFHMTTVDPTSDNAPNQQHTGQSTHGR